MRFTALGWPKMLWNRSHQCVFVLCSSCVSLIYPNIELTSEPHPKLRDGQMYSYLMEIVTQQLEGYSSGDSIGLWCLS